MIRPNSVRRIKPIISNGFAFFLETRTQLTFKKREFNKINMCWSNYLRAYGSLYVDHKVFCQKNNSGLAAQL